MSDHHKHDKKKQKKLHQLMHNLKHLHINQAAQALERNLEVEREREEEVREASAASSRAAASKNKPGNVVWSAELQKYRDKNTGRMRMATERWNRFAGTEGGGGRGL